jgi:ABC-type phosphate/phosphonate transport system substrate-binding protein
VFIRRLGLIAAVSACLGVTFSVDAGAQARFVTVDQGTGELRADRALAQQLGRELIEAPEPLPYGAVIDDLIADERREGIVARVTPYALVVAEMRGAKLDPIATCRSRSTHRTVINAFLVVPRSAFADQQLTSAPALPQVLDHLRARSEAGPPATFIYHDKLSTSSYFLPSLFFRAQRIFAVDDQTSAPDGTTTIRVVLHQPKSSAELVKAVATGQADVASVWDGSKSSFDDKADEHYDAYGSRVWFVRMPTDLPCDVLVATRRVDAATRQRIRDSLPGTPAGPGFGDKSDVEAWLLWTDPGAGEARTALSGLRRQAAASALPVVVDVHNGGESKVDARVEDAVRRGIQLAGTELVDKSEYYDYFVKSDVRWDLESIHEGAVRITVRYDNFKRGGSEVTQQFEVSFLEPGDLTRRVVSLVHSRLHRIRPIWLYRNTAPTVLRDVGFDVDDVVPFQEIEWTDPQRNDYKLRREPGEARLVRSDFNFELDKSEFLRDGKLDFEPMGRLAYRVLLIRPTPERTLFRILTVTFVLLLGLAAAGLVWDVFRGRTQAAAGAARHVDAPSRTRAVPAAAALDSRTSSPESHVGPAPVWSP